MYVIKRDKKLELFSKGKIICKLESLCLNLDTKFVDIVQITNKISENLCLNVTTTNIIELAAEITASMSTQHPDYAILAGRLAVSNLHKLTKNDFSEVINDIYCYDGEKLSIISKLTYNIVKENASILDASINHARDFYFNYFGFKTLEKSYLLKINNNIVERPQHMLMRVAVGIHGYDIKSVLETYELMSNRLFIHATPTLFNAGTTKPQLSSCYLVTMENDSLEGVFNTLKTCALISKYTGGIGLNIHNIRAKGARISGSNGVSGGIVPMLKIFNNTARYTYQGNKRPGVFAIYLEPWHVDVFDFLDLKKNTGKAEFRARDLFYGLWIPNIFMKRVLAGEKWSLMCPNKCKNLENVWGNEFDKLYENYEKNGMYMQQIDARKLWNAIIISQIETGNPYMLYKDACNKKSNQQNLGTIKCSNLCTEIIEFSSPNEIAVCNLASIAINMFVNSDKIFDFNKLLNVVKVVTRNLDKIIDVNYYPVPEAEKSNKSHRPIGIGVQGLADTFMLMGFPFESSSAQLLNKQIFETIYYGALDASCDLAKDFGPYSSYENSPISNGILQYDMWNITPTDLHNWDDLKLKIKKYGVRNSLLTTVMPTASTAQILGNNESIEPITSNMYVRRVLSGDFQVVNHHLVKDLIQLNLWNKVLKDKIILNGGSIQDITEIPNNLKKLYKTVWEIPQKTLINMAADRGPFIDQSQSLNIYLEKPNYSMLCGVHFYAWQKGLKTGMYYLRTKPSANPIQFTIDKNNIECAQCSG